jgi:hypothetical protein
MDPRDRDELGRHLEAVVDEEPVAVDPAASGMLADLLEQAAARLREQPDRAQEADENLRLLLRHAAAVEHGVPTADELSEDQLRATVVTEVSMRRALRDLCPLFPIC